MIRRFLSDQSGATAIEYAIMATLISAGLIAAVMTIGQTLSGIFNSVNAGFTG